MKPEAQRIAIAEWCGWTQSQDDNDPTWWTHSPDEKYFFGDMEKYWPLHVIPDYLNDLNAIHEAELSAFKTPSERCDYLCHLENVASRTRKVAPDNTIDPMTQWACFTTAAQRSEALLRTIGKWTETHPTGEVK